jgi:branched-chain amino acid transport system substrate-binding protein
MKLEKHLGLSLAVLLSLWTAAPMPTAAQDSVKIGYTESLSGTFAQIGDQGIKSIQAVVDEINTKGGVLGKKLELVPIDNKAQPADALQALQKMVDDGLPIILNCGPSNIAAALVDGVNKHNDRNKDRRIVYVNCGAVAPELTNEKCSFWHFRTDAHAGMKAEIMVRGLPKTTTKVYMINQDYLFGQAVQRDLRLFLEKLRPDVQIVGDEMVPLGKVKDFSSYVAKIKVSGAQALLTGNWGPDLSLLVKAGMDAGLGIDYYAYYAHLAGGPTAIGPAGNGKVHSVMNFSENMGLQFNKPEVDAWVQAFRAKHDFDFVFGDRRLGIELIAKAINKAGSTDALRIAQAMEGLSWTDTVGQPVIMRADDHQILMPYYLGTFTTGMKYDSEKTGLGWRIDTTITAADIAQPTTCKMKRPAS